MDLKELAAILNECKFSPIDRHEREVFQGASEHARIAYSSEHTVILDQDEDGNFRLAFVGPGGDEDVVLAQL